MLTDKKIACLWGNCQTRILERIFTFYHDFAKEYVIVELPKVFEYELYAEIITHLMERDSFWEHVDLFIYQTVKKNNRFHEIMATEGILRRLRAETVKVNILNLYFTGYFPQMAERPERKQSVEYHLITYYKDSYIDKMLSSGMRHDMIKAEVMREDFISADEVLMVALSSLKELAEREKDADVKITDYIIHHYREEQLFYTASHPSEKLLMEYAARIMAYLGYSDGRISITDVYMSCGLLKVPGAPVYPSVIRALGLKKYERRYYLNKVMVNQPLTFEEHIDLYIADSETKRRTN